ncbi:MAG TPA: thioredoxin family protein [Microbacteriaceae bacterium]|nr:thioredoxin family protein [Microbacteriaceae bacterium]
MQFELYTSAFCGPCRGARQVLADAERLVPRIHVREFDVVRDEARAKEQDIRSTPTIIVRDGTGRQVFRAQGVPRLGQVLVAAASAL